MSETDWYQIAGKAWAKVDAQYLGDEEPEPLTAEAAALGPGLRAAVDAVLAAARADQWRAGYDAAVEEMRGVVDRTGSPAANWAALYLAAQRKYVERRVLDSSGTARCCDMHNRNCEPPSELCCNRCTEVAHDTFPTRHADGSACVLDSSETPPAAPGDQACGKCGTVNVVWFTPDNDLWNRVEEATRRDVLCVTCFVRIAEDVLGVVPPAWMVSPEPRPESDGRWVWQAAPVPEERSDEKKLMRSRWPKPVGRDTVALDAESDPEPAPERSDEEPKRSCPRCGSPRWVAVSLDEGWTRRAQCVPCGAYHPGVIGPGWQAQLRSDFQ